MLTEEFRTASKWGGEELSEQSADAREVHIPTTGIFAPAPPLNPDIPSLSGWIMG